MGIRATLERAEALAGTEDADLLDCLRADIAEADALMGQDAGIARAHAIEAADACEEALARTVATT